MGDFHRCIEPILTEEGGYVNHPNDPGGETKFGISKRAYPHLAIRNLTRARAVSLYQSDYWQPIRGDQFPNPLALLLLDTAVNMGTQTAIRFLQRALNLPDDGLIGPQTLNAVKNHSAPGDLLTHIAAERAYRYKGLRHTDTFARGWYRRLLHIHAIAWSWTL